MNKKPESLGLSGTAGTVAMPMPWKQAGFSCFLAHKEQAQSTVVTFRMRSQENACSTV